MNNNLIVKNNFYAKSSETGDFVFIPTGSSIKLVEHNISPMPYYEIETHRMIFNFKEDSISIDGTRLINSKQSLKLRSCMSEVVDGKPQISSFNNPLLWNSVFVQSLEDVISV
tara:strand:- start:511 stop:849 length:339 start_codon:yes stop_codon:yes gene_type:complete